MDATDASITKRLQAVQNELVTAYEKGHDELVSFMKSWAQLKDSIIAAASTHSLSKETLQLAANVAKPVAAIASSLLAIEVARAKMVNELQEEAKDLVSSQHCEEDLVDESYDSDTQSLPGSYFSENDDDWEDPEAPDYNILRDWFFAHIGSPFLSPQEDYADLLQNAKVDRIQFHHWLEYVRQTSGWGRIFVNHAHSTPQKMEDLCSQLFDEFERGVPRTKSAYPLAVRNEVKRFRTDFEKIYDFNLSDWWGPVHEMLDVAGYSIWDSNAEAEEWDSDEYLSDEECSVQSSDSEHDHSLDEVPSDIPAWRFRDPTHAGPASTSIGIKRKMMESSHHQQSTFNHSYEADTEVWPPFKRRRIDNLPTIPIENLTIQNNYPSQRPTALSPSSTGSRTACATPESSLSYSKSPVDQIPIQAPTFVQLLQRSHSSNTSPSPSQATSPTVCSEIEHQEQPQGAEEHQVQFIRSCQTQVPPCKRKREAYVEESENSPSHPTGQTAKVDTNVYHDRQTDSSAKTPRHKEPKRATKGEGSSRVSSTNNRPRKRQRLGQSTPLILPSLGEALNRVSSEVSRIQSQPGPTRSPVSSWIRETESLHSHGLEPISRHIVNPNESVSAPQSLADNYMTHYGSMYNATSLGTTTAQTWDIFDTLASVIASSNERSILTNDNSAFTPSPHDVLSETADTPSFTYGSPDDASSVLTGDVETPKSSVMHLLTSIAGWDDMPGAATPAPGMKLEHASLDPPTSASIKFSLDRPPVSTRTSTL
ncbi:hypothetical protein FRC19_009573 [Serendipita sp. 401]|nr:hypothetical protein FRC19_009573 [Serendipita sp. 401]KAG9052872.1 hypothetical protein FS842_009114 [Serendipita sp. 407]